MTKMNTFNATQTRLLTTPPTATCTNISLSDFACLKTTTSGDATRNTLPAT
jgi:hypothetical protein